MTCRVANQFRGRKVQELVLDGEAVKIYDNLGFALNLVTSMAMILVARPVLIAFGGGL